MQAVFHRQDAQGNALCIIFYASKVWQVFAARSQEDIAVKMIQKLYSLCKIMHANSIRRIAYRAHKAQIFCLLLGTGLLNRCRNYCCVGMRGVNDARRTFSCQESLHSLQVHTLCHNRKIWLRLNQLRTILRCHRNVQLNLQPADFLNQPAALSRAANQPDYRLHTSL